MTNKIFSSLKVIALAVVLSFGLSYVYAWTAPTVAPTGGNVSAPVNTSGTAQTKTGNLGVSGKVGIGTTVSNYRLSVGTDGADNNPFAVSDSGDISVSGGSDLRWGLFKKDGVGNYSEKIGLEPSGEVTVTAKVRANNSDVYFTKTDHSHTGDGNAIGHAAIENASSHDTLMILGRAGVRGGVWGRSVSIWDRLDVNGSLYVNGAPITQFPPLTSSEPCNSTSVGQKALSVKLGYDMDGIPTSTLYIATCAWTGYGFTGYSWR